MIYQKVGCTDVQFAILYQCISQVFLKNHVLNVDLILIGL